MRALNNLYAASEKILSKTHPRLAIAALFAGSLSLGVNLGLVADSLNEKQEDQRQSFQSRTTERVVVDMDLTKEANFPGDDFTSTANQTPAEQGVARALELIALVNIRASGDCEPSEPKESFLCVGDEKLGTLQGLQEAAVQLDTDQFKAELVTNNQIPGVDDCPEIDKAVFCVENAPDSQRSIIISTDDKGNLSRAVSSVSVGIDAEGHIVALRAK